MKTLLELLPIVLFFAVYQMNGTTVSLGDWSYTVDGIYSATAVLMIATVIQVAGIWLVTRQLEKRLLWMLIGVLVFGGLTLTLRNQAFIQWKPTVFNWGMAIGFLIGQRYLGEPVLKRLMGGQIQLPDPVWQRLTLLWIGNFLLVGTLNLVIAYGFSEATWVAYKLYSSIGFTLLLVALTIALIAPHIKEHDTPNP